MRIKQLPIQLANQIAAGEVIERPASVVKECLENAIDANATEITVEIDRGGMERIVICDNGEGIEPDDLSLSIAPHATSKISNVTDLNDIGTLGFRGEALASISAVSHCRIASKTKTAAIASELKIAGGQDLIISSTAHPDGTTVEVNELFFNVPVRRTFLKSEKAEYLQVESVVKRVALSQFSISLTLIHNGKIIFKLPKAISQEGRDKRVIKLFGKPFFDTAKWIDIEGEGIKVSGYLGSPDFMRSQNDLQYMYINSRMVRDKLLNHAIKQVYQPLLYPGRVPSFLLFMTISPRDIDVNVHPTKHEVRFKYARAIHDFFIRELKQILSPEEHQLEESIYEPIAHAELSSSYQNGVTHDEEVHLNHSSFIDLGEGVALMVEDDESTVFELSTLYQSMIMDKLLLGVENDSIVSRPLLVPTVYTLSELALNHFPFELISELGFDVSPVDVDKLLVRAFPVVTPHLDMAGCMEKLSCVNSLNAAIEVISRAQSVSLSSLISEERAELLVHFKKVRNSKAKKMLYRTMKYKDWKALLRGQYA